MRRFSNNTTRGPVGVIRDIKKKETEVNVVTIQGLKLPHMSYSINSFLLQPTVFEQPFIAAACACARTDGLYSKGSDDLMSSLD